MLDGCTLPVTNMETHKGLYKDYNPFNGRAIWVSMLVWGSVESYEPKDDMLFSTRGPGG